MDSQNKEPRCEEIFPQEIMMEILSRLPPKPLARFKSVNKHWYSMISSRFFVMEKHLGQMRRQGRYVFLLQEEFGYHALVYEKQGSDAEYKRVVIEFDAKWETMANCNGMVCFCNVDDEYFLGNPATKNCIKIPQWPIQCTGHSKWCYCIFGLGYDPVAEEYKLVRLCLFNNVEAKIEVSIFYSNSRMWRRVGDFPFDSPCQYPGIFVNGKLHWQVQDLGTHYGICSFDVVTEEYGFIEIPDETVSMGHGFSIGSLDDSKLILYTTFCKRRDEFVIWIHEDSAWTRMRINLATLNVSDEKVLFFTPLCIRAVNKEWILLRLEPDVTLFMYHKKLEYLFEFETNLIPSGYGTVFRCLTTIEEP